MGLNEVFPTQPRRGDGRHIRVRQTYQPARISGR